MTHELEDEDPVLNKKIYQKNECDPSCIFFDGDKCIADEDTDMTSEDVAECCRELDVKALEDVAISTGVIGSSKSLKRMIDATLAKTLILGYRMGYADSKKGLPAKVK